MSVIFCPMMMTVVSRRTWLTFPKSTPSCITKELQLLLTLSSTYNLRHEQIQNFLIGCLPFSYISVFQITYQRFQRTLDLKPTSGDKKGINFQIKIRKTAKGFILILTMKIVITYLKRHLFISVKHPKNDSRSSSFDGVVSKILFSREIWKLHWKLSFLFKAYDTCSSCFIVWTVVGIFTSATSVYFQ